MGSGRLVHERHELIRKPRHGAGDANAADIRTAADPPHPAALRHVAVHYRTPAADFHQALGGAVFVGEIALLVITGAIASLVNRLAEKPRGTELLVEGDDWRQTRGLVQQVQQSLGEVVGLNGAAWNVHDGEPAGGAEALA